MDMYIQSRETDFSSKKWPSICCRMDVASRLEPRRRIDRWTLTKPWVTDVVSFLSDFILIMNSVRYILLSHLPFSHLISSIKNKRKNKQTRNFFLNVYCIHSFKKPAEKYRVDRLVHTLWDMFWTVYVTLITKSIIRDKHPAVQGAYSRIDDIQKLVVGFAVAAMRPVSIDGKKKKTNL